MNSPHETTAVVLRPSAAVHVVDDGLLLAGRESSLVRCGTGLRNLWTRIAPEFAAGVDPETLAVPDKAAAAVRALVDTMRAQEMLVPAPRTGDEWLDAVAPDPVAATERLRTDPVAVLGPEPACSRLRAALTGAGVRLGPRGLGVLVGDSASVLGNARVVALDCAGGWLVAGGISPDVVSAAARRLAAARRPSDHPDPVPGLREPLVTALTVDAVLEQLADRRIGARLVDENGARPVALVPPLRELPRWLPLPKLPAGWAARDDRTALDAAADWFDPLLGVLPEPLPGTLPQLPLAMNAATVDGRLLIGAGPDHDGARVATALHVLRHQTMGRSVADPRPARIAVAGVGTADFLADALGRLAAAGPVAPANPESRVTRRCIRWVHGITAESGEAPRVVAGHSSTVDGAWVAQARVTGRGARGYGGTKEHAVEHALRALLARLVVPAENRADVDTAHLPEVAPRLLDSVGVTAGPVRLPGLSVRLLDPAAGFDATGLLVGEAWVTS